MVQEKRNRQAPTQWQKDLKKFHKLSDRHILVVESDLTDTNKIMPIVRDANNLRKAKNELVKKMQKRYHELIRTKKQMMKIKRKVLQSN